MALTSDDERIVVVLFVLLSELRFILLSFLRLYISIRRRRLDSTTRSIRHYNFKKKVIYQISHIRDLVGVNDDVCRKNLRMPIHSFKRLCFLLETVGGLRPTRNVNIYEQVAMFLSILAHHKKNVTLQTDFKRSGYTVSVYFNRVLKCLIGVYHLFVATPIPIDEDCMDSRWKYFKV